MLNITFLEARVPLAKTFGRDPQGQLTKSSYPHVKKVTSHTEEISTLQLFAEAIEEHATEQHCLLKGTLNRDLEDESRAGATDKIAATNWLCLDLDGLKGIQTPKAFMMLLGLQEYSYVLQYSSSMGVDPDKGLSCHIFVELAESVLPSRLRAWLMHQNLSIPKLRKELLLASDYMSLRYGLDISTCDNGKILYIAPPVVQEGVEDTFEGKRIQYVKSKRERIPLTALQLDALAIDALTAERNSTINKLREEQGLQPREYATRTFRGEAVIANPDIAEISSYREERGFAYFNINNGDSWSYYHPLSNPYVIYCFKGDQRFATKDFLPNYLEDHGLERAKLAKKEEQEASKERAREDYEHSLISANKRTEGKTWLAFLDVSSDSYYRGFFDHDNDNLSLNRTNSLIKVMHFMRDNGQEEMDWVPEWNLCFDYLSNNRFNPKDRRINLYQPTDYLKAPAPSASSRRARNVPPTIAKVIKHVVSNDEQCYNDFLNWLACIIQKKEFPRTAWVFFGVQGTGKGTLFHKIITPILGDKYCQSKLFKDMEEQFNGWLEQTVFCMIDEVSVGDAKHKERLMANLKQNITEPRVSVRAMRTDSRMVLNNCSYILCSNKPDPVIVEDSDRRFHIAPYQDEKIKLSTHERDSLLPIEIQDFVTFLRAYEVDAEAARTPRDNDTKEQLKHISRNAIDSVALALKTGDIEFFFDQLPKDLRALEIHPDEATQSQARAYKAFMNELVSGELDADQQIRLHRDDLREVLNYLVGSMPSSPNKFTAYLKHHGIHPRKLRIAGRLGQGIEVTPKRHSRYVEEWDAYLNLPPKPGGSVTQLPLQKKGRAKTARRS